MLTSIKNIHCIDINWIEEYFNKSGGQGSDMYQMGRDAALSELYIQLKDQLKPIHPLIEDAFNSGRNIEYKDSSSDGGETFESVPSIEIEDYINNKQFVPLNVLNYRNSDKFSKLSL